MIELMIDPATARAHIQSNWPNDPLLRTIGLNLVDTLPKEEVERVTKKEGCRYCRDGEPFATHIDGKAEIVKLTPLPAIDLNTGEQEDTVRPPFAAIWTHSQDNGEDFVPIEFCPKCGRQLKEDVFTDLEEEKTKCLNSANCRIYAACSMKNISSSIHFDKRSEFTDCANYFKCPNALHGSGFLTMLRSKSWLSIW